MENKPSNNTATIKEVLDLASVYISKQSDLKLIKKAYRFALKHHGEQLRRSGEPYIIHPLEVCKILTQYNTGPDTLCAGLMHDLIEDTHITFDDIKSEFNTNVATLVEGVTKISVINYRTQTDFMIDNYRKMIISMIKDVRVIVIKLADRLHNMRTLKFLPLEKQLRISNETLEIFAPIAHRLGMYTIKSELEDLSLRYIDPDGFYKIVKLLKQRKVERQEIIDELTMYLSELLKEKDIPFEISGRAKHIYSIHRKMEDTEKSFNDIFDLHALRIIVDTIPQCYTVLGILHAEFRPIPGRVKDYIAMPKPNLYQSLHTTVIGKNKKAFEIQIRTNEMDETAEYGIASHWAYKENRKVASKIEQQQIEEKLSWFRSLISLQQDADSAEDFVEGIKNDIFNANVYAFTPRGDVINLPYGATPIDFAYRVHTEIGDHMVGAIVNNKIVPLNYEIKTGDIIEIKVNKNSFGPSEDWIRFVKTSCARNKIKQFYHKLRKHESVEIGKEKLNKRLKELRILPSTFLASEGFKELLDSLGYTKVEELYNNIGYNVHTSEWVISKVNENKEELSVEEEIEKNLSKHNKYKSKLGVVVPGISNLKVEIANCCKPIPGDVIVGYVSSGYGLKVHRKRCKNIQNVIDINPSKIIDVEWSQEKDLRYETIIVITSLDRPNLYADLFQAITSQAASTTKVDSKQKFNIVNIKLTILVRNTAHLTKLAENLKKLEGILSLERSIK